MFPDFRSPLKWTCLILRLLGLFGSVFSCILTSYNDLKYLSGIKYMHITFHDLNTIHIDVLFNVHNFLTKNVLKISAISSSSHYNIVFFQGPVLFSFRVV